MSGHARTGRLCAAVQRVVGQWLAFESPDETLQSLFVEAVELAPDASRLQVTVSVPDDLPVGSDDVLRRLHLALPDLQRELARAVNRRRNPELAFVVIRAG